MMYQIMNKLTGEEYTVYAVDALHDAFLVYDWSSHRFRWVPIDDYRLASDKEKAAPEGNGYGREM